MSRFAPVVMQESANDEGTCRIRGYLVICISLFFFFLSFSLLITNLQAGAEVQVICAARA